MQIKNYIIIVSLWLPLLTISQTNDLSGFENLVNKTWLAEGKWSNGNLFKQEVSYKFDLNKSIIITKSKGYIDEEQTKFGKRNHGIRQYNKATKKIDFWEFDIFGNLTKGIVVTEGKNIWYFYNYNGIKVADCWEYINDKTYRYIVGKVENRKLVSIYIETEFKLKDNN